MPTASNPFPYFPEAGNNGFIYIGAANQDAQAVPVTVYRDEARTIPWAQPIRTVDGYPAYQGATEGIFLASPTYSITVQDRNGNTFVNETLASDPVASFAAALASSTGASLVGFSHAETYANGTVGKHLKAFIVASDAPWNVVGDDSTDNASAINTALAYAYSLGGGDVMLPTGVIRHSATIDIKYPRVRLVGRGGNAFHDSGTDSTHTVLRPTFAGTAVKVRTPYAAEQGVSVGSTFRYWGAGFVGCSINCAGIATRALEVDSVAGAEIDVYATGCVGTNVFVVKCGVTGTDLGTPCDVQFSKMTFRARQIDTAPEQSARILELQASSTGNANVSLNRLPAYGISVYAQHKNGAAFYGAGGDNNDVSVTAIRAAGGTGDTIFCEGATVANPVGFSANRFYYVQGSGAIYLQGTDTPGVTAIRFNEFWIDDGNGTPFPIGGTGAKWKSHSIDYGTESFGNYVQSVFSDNRATAVTQRAAMGLETQRIYNDSGLHQVLASGTTEWSVGLDGADIRILRLSGTGAVNVGAGSPVKIGNKLVTEGASDSGGVGYRVLRVPN